MPRVKEISKDVITRTIRKVIKTQNSKELEISKRLALTYALTFKDWLIEGDGKVGEIDFRCYYNL